MGLPSRFLLVPLILRRAQHTPSETVMSVFLALLRTRSSARSRAALQLGVLAWRHQLQVTNRSRPQRMRLGHSDRLLWVCLPRWTVQGRRRKRDDS